MRWTLSNTELYILLKHAIRISLQIILVFFDIDSLIYSPIQEPGGVGSQSVSIATVLLNNNTENKQTMKILQLNSFTNRPVAAVMKL